MCASPERLEVVLDLLAEPLVLPEHHPAQQRRLRRREPLAQPGLRPPPHPVQPPGEPTPPLPGRRPRAAHRSPRARSAAADTRPRTRAAPPARDRHDVPHPHSRRRPARPRPSATDGAGESPPPATPPAVAPRTAPPADVALVVARGQRPSAGRPARPRPGRRGGARARPTVRGRGADGFEHDRARLDRLPVHRARARRRPARRAVRRRTVAPPRHAPPRPRARATTGAERARRSRTAATRARRPRAARPSRSPATSAASTRWRGCRARSPVRRTDADAGLRARPRPRTRFRRGRARAGPRGASRRCRRPGRARRRTEAAVLLAVVEDLLGGGRTDAVERVELLERGGVEVDRAGRRAPGAAGRWRWSSARRLRARRDEDLAAVLELGGAVDRLRSARRVAPPARSSASSTRSFVVSR